MAKRRANNEGSLFFSEYEDRWIAEITLPDGKRKRKRSQKQSVVKKWLLEQRKALSENRLLSADNITLGDYLERFMQDVVVHNLKPKTIDSYRYIIENHVKPEIGHIQLANLRPDYLQNLYAEKLKSGLSRRTVQYIHAVIRRALNEAVRLGLIYRNPTDAVTAPRPKKKIPETLSENQAKRFLKAVEHHRLYPLYVLAITTGMRRGELLGIHWEDVDFESSTVSVKRTVSSIRGKIVVGAPKTSEARRTISMPEYTKEVLKAHQDQSGEATGLVFKTSSGKPISPRNVVRHFKNVLEKEGLPDVRFHDLRHTAATLLLKQNVHPKVVQEMLGHSTITTTLDTYSHVIPGMQEKAAEKMDKMFGE